MASVLGGLINEGGEDDPIETRGSWRGVAEVAVAAVLAAAPSDPDEVDDSSGLLKDKRSAESRVPERLDTTLELGGGRSGV